MNRPIWKYSSSTISSGLLSAVFSARTCPCCPAQPLLIPQEECDVGDGRTYSENQQVLVCTLCGWWFSFIESYDSSCRSAHPETALHRVNATGAALAKYTDFPDPTTINILRTEVEAHLHKNGTSNEWRAMEVAVVGILGSFGYQARVTARTRDGGFDAVFEHPTFGTVFVQVKHSKNSVGVATFRELVGTMHLNRTHHGILVTSSRFTNGVDKLLVQAEDVGTSIELVDGEGFLAALDLTTCLTPPTLRQVLDVAKPSIAIINREIEI